MYKVSVIMPGYRTHLWQGVYNSLVTSFLGIPFELIIIGPTKPDFSLDNVKFIQDFGCPSRCFQRGASHATGEYLTWICDDGVALPGAMKRCYDRMVIENNEKFILGQNYFEGGDIRIPDFFRMRYHQDGQLPGIKESYITSVMMMCNTAYFKKLGGIDCGFEHTNMNIHDFNFRCLNDGGKIEIFMDPVFDIEWDVTVPSYIPVRRAWQEVDSPRWKALYSQDQSNRVYIDFDNWKASPASWNKRFVAPMGNK